MARDKKKRSAVVAPSGEGPQPPGKPPIEPRLIRPDELAEMLGGIGRRTLDRMVAAGKVGPRRIVLHARVIVWDRVEIDAWLNQRTPEGELYDEAGWAAVRDEVMHAPQPAGAAPPDESTPAQPRRPRKQR